MVKDAFADYSDREMQAALDINMPSYARDREHNGDRRVPLMSSIRFEKNPLTFAVPVPT